MRTTMAFPSSDQERAWEVAAAAASEVGGPIFLRKEEVESVVGGGARE